MIRDRYDPMQLFDLVPQLQLRFEPELAELDRLLEDDRLFQQVKADLARRCPKTTVTGRPGTPVEVVLRLLVVKHLYGWSYEQTEQFVGDSLVLRQFCRLYLATTPADTTLLRWANLIQPETLHHLLARVTELAAAQRVTRGRKLRTDSTVVETNIHHPSDSTLLADGVRVLSRLVRRAQSVRGAVGAAASALYRDRTRSAKRLAHRIGEAAAHAPARRADPRPALYQRLLAVARASLRQAAQVRERVAATAGAAARLGAALDRVLPLVERVVEQTARRVLHGESVPAGAKVLSLFEPHTAVLRRGKVRQPTEFGRKLVLDEVDGGLVSRYAVLPGNPPDAASVLPSVAHHCVQFGHPPAVLTGDRGTYSPDNEAAALAAGVRQVALPQPGTTTPARRAHERQRWFRRARRWRSGIEGRISVLRRGFGLARCRYHGEAGMERWVGWAIITHNLRTISRTVAARRAA